MIFITLGGPQPRAEEAAVAPPVHLPAQMTDNELVSYISGRLRAELAPEEYKVSRACAPQSPCDVIVERAK